MTDDKFFAVVDKHSGEQIWAVAHKKIGRAKLSVRHNSFISRSVGVAEVKNGQAVGPIEVYNSGTDKWEEVTNG